LQVLQIVFCYKRFPHCWQADMLFGHWFLRHLTGTAAFVAFEGYRKNNFLFGACCNDVLWHLKPAQLNDDLIEEHFSRIEIHIYIYISIYIIYIYIYSIRQHIYIYTVCLYIYIHSIYNIYII
jgi:hypothetical protein